MAENELFTQTGRNSEEIRRDIAREERSISRTVDRIGDRLKENMDWRAYVADHPYASLGVVAGVGFLAGYNLTSRPSPMDRLVHTMAGEMRGAVEDMAPPKRNVTGLLAAVLGGMASKTAATWVRHAITAPSPRGEVRPLP